MFDLDRMIVELRAARNEIGRLEKENKQLKELVAKAIEMLREPSKQSVENAAMGGALRAAVARMSGKP